MTREQKNSNAFRFQPPNFFLNQMRHLVLGVIHVRQVRVEFLGHFPGWPPPNDVRVKELKELGIDLPFDAFEGHLRQVLFPVPFPNRVEIEAGWVRDALGGGSSARVSLGAPRCLAGPQALSELVMDAPSRRIQ